MNDLKRETEKQESHNVLKSLEAAKSHCWKKKIVWYEILFWRIWKKEWF